ncbi:GerMN domain-containing protein [Thermatribacter velox]|uniref:GerMN domain-containing protein n=1 Tax=Thermatribacter velox TaxID=3039681 RepID=A0ABZ2YEA4_9BACT
MRKGRKRSRKNLSFVLQALLYLLIGVGLFFAVVYGGELLFVNKKGVERSEEKATPRVVVPLEESQESPLSQGSASSQGEKEVVLYFTDENFIYLFGEKRAVKNDAHFLENVVEALLKGPETEGLYSPIPKDTRLNAIFVEDGTAYVDLSEEMISGQSGGTSQEFLSVFSLVNTLTGLGMGIERVKILVDGEDKDTLCGHIDISRPLGRDEKTIAKIQ